MSFRAFAKAIGVSHQAVSKGAQTGRLSRSIGHDRRGRPCIAALELARREWTANAARPAKDEGPLCTAAPEDATDLGFALLTFALERAPETVTRRGKDGAVTRVDLGALRTWLAEAGHDGIRCPASLAGGGIRA